MTAYLKNPVNPVAGQCTPISRLAPYAQVSAFGTPENVRQAVLSGLAHSKTKEIPPWAKELPTKLEGPFLCVARQGEEVAKDEKYPTIYGPVDPNLLDPQTVVAIYYACYPTHTPSSAAFNFDLEVLDPVLGGMPLVGSSAPVPEISPPTPSQPQLEAVAEPELAAQAQAQVHPQPAQPKAHSHKRNSVPSLSRDQIIKDETTSGVDPFKVPEVDMSARKRAPRKCGVCGQYYCKGGLTTCEPYLKLYKADTL